MRETVRQFVIFGNFNSVKFDNVLNLKEIRSRYNLQLNAMPDIPNPPDNNQGGQPIAPGIVINGVQTLESRPIFQTSDKRFQIFFGTKRIHIEEFEGSSESYFEFNKKAVEIICEIIHGLKLKVIRVALNGRLYNDDKKWATEAFNKIFNRTELYSDNSMEWQFHIASKENNTVLGCEINKIASYARGNFIDGLGKMQNGIIANYDFNTQVNIEKIFNEKEIRLFNECAQKYRSQFI